MRPEVGGRRRRRAPKAEFSGDSLMSKYQDVIELKSNDVRTLTGRVLTPEGIMDEHHDGRVSATAGPLRVG